MKPLLLTLICACSIETASTSLSISPGLNPRTTPIYILAGQSNALGDGTPVHLPQELQVPYEPVQFAWQLSCPDRAMDPCIYEGYGMLQPLDTHGVEISWGRAFPDGSLLLKAATGATDLRTDWHPDPGRGGTLYGRMVDWIQSWIDATVGAELRCFAWIQGEGDTGRRSSTEEYSSNLDQLIKSLRLDIGDGLRVVVVQLHRDITAPYAVAIRLAQRCVADHDDGVFLVDVDDVPLGPDGLHYQSAALVTIGERIAEVCK